MLNQIVIMGRLTRDPELRYTQSGTPVASFTLAVDRDFADKENGERQTDFIDCVAWRQSGEFVTKYFQKGSMAIIKGRLQIRDWEDKDGNKRRSAEVVADSVYFGEAKKSDSGNDGENHSSNNRKATSGGNGGGNNKNSNGKPTFRQLYLRSSSKAGFRRHYKLPGML